MQVIYKYVLNPGANALAFPADSKVLSVGVQGRDVVMWVMHEARGPYNPDKTEVLAERIGRRVFETFMTGQSMPPTKREFIGTVQLIANAHTIVIHVFEILD